MTNRKGQTSARIAARPYDIYKRIDPSAGALAEAPARYAKRSVREIVARKRGR